MHEIYLDARGESDLEWVHAAYEVSAHSKPVLWHFIFDPFTDQSLPVAERAVEYFLETLYPLFQSRTVGVRLYDGIPDKDLSPYLDQLVALLPEGLDGYARFELSHISSKATRAKLISPERYPWLRLETSQNTDAPLGLLIPLEEACTPERLEHLDQIIGQINEPLRIVYEYNFTESWDELDQVIVVSDYLSPMGRRKIAGFEAAGGKMIGVEGFEPPAFCSQSRRASQAALYPESKCSS